MNVRILVIFALALTLLLAACGGSNKRASQTVKSSAQDAAYVKAMIPHHQSAVGMALIAQKRATNPFVKNLADDIIASQKEEIGIMKKLQSTDLQGIKPGSIEGGMKMSMGDLQALNRASSKDFNSVFVNMMIPHHISAVTMSKAVLAESKNDNIKGLANGILSAQESEIKQMNDFAKNQGAVRIRTHSG